MEKLAPAASGVSGAIHSRDCYLLKNTEKRIQNISVSMMANGTRGVSYAYPILMC